MDLKYYSNHYIYCFSYSILYENSTFLVQRYWKGIKKGEPNKSWLPHMKCFADYFFT